MTSIGKAILKTLAYADIFDYPLTSGELYQFLIADKTLSFSSFKKVLSRINADLELIDADKNFFFLKGRQKIVVLRKKREKWSKKKLKKAKKIANLLKLIPTVKMVGVTGALAMNNSDKDDDIDILIVSTKGRLWLTRLLVTILVELTGSRRHPLPFEALPNSSICRHLARSKVRDKICLNMFLEEKHLVVPKKEQDLFSAHEVVQMKKLWDRDNTYSRFLWENRWVRKYLANGIDTKILRYDDIKEEQKKLKSLSILISQYLNIFENLAYKIQLKYMKSRKTSEITEASRIRFHPQDARIWVLKKFSQKLKRLKS